jgi:hypothetical protein
MADVRLSEFSARHAFVGLVPAWCGDELRVEAARAVAEHIDFLLEG